MQGKEGDWLRLASIITITKRHIAHSTVQMLRCCKHFLQVCIKIILHNICVASLAMVD